MNRVWGKIARAVFVACLCHAAPTVYADRVELINGDVLNGQIIKQSERGVILKHDLLGTLAIGQDRIARVVTPPADQPTDATNDEPAKPADAPKPGPETEPDTETKVKNKAKQAAKKQQPSVLPDLMQEWNSRLTLGINGASGNTETQQYYAKFDSKYEDGRDRANFNARWFYAFADGNQTQNQFETNVTRDWLQKDSDYFFFLKGQYKHDGNRAWENRTSGFGGGGYTLTKTEDVELNTRLGFGGTYEFGDNNQFTPEALFGGSVVKWNLTQRAAIQGETIYYPSLADSDRYRIESKLEWTFKLDTKQGLSLRLGLENDYESESQSDPSRNDLKYFGALVLNF